MLFSSDLAEIRFGVGLSPDLPAVSSVEVMLQGVKAADQMAARFPIDSFDSCLPQLVAMKTLNRKRRVAVRAETLEPLEQQIKLMQRQARQDRARWFGQRLLRHSQTQDGLRERLAGFWADHFTAQGKTGLLRTLGAPYVESAIRPNLSGSFSDLLIAAVTHPLMLHYLDQSHSVGPNSRRAQRSKRRRGLNENLAREVMELHSLGVDGPYTQQDVRQLAELFTGLSFTPQDGFKFRPGRAEPGPETVLGQEYGGDPAQLEPIYAVLRDLALHPATASHIARKLVVHFVSDQPDPNLVDHVAARFRATDGDLLQVYAALLEHPAAWEGALRNVKPPADFMATACRALALTQVRMDGFSARQILKTMVWPLRMMGQAWEHPGGPDGWPEQDTAWITPQGLAARMRWAMVAPQKIRAELPEPEQFAETSLGRFANGRVRFAASAAETRAEAIGLVLSSPAFQRR